MFMYCIILKNSLFSRSLVRCGYGTECGNEAVVDGWGGHDTSNVLSHLMCEIQVQSRGYHTDEVKGLSEGEGDICPYFFAPFHLCSSHLPFRLDQSKGQ